jgi:hypothetical protein
MTDKPQKIATKVPFALKIIFGLILAVVLGCGGIYLSIAFPKLRGDFVAWQATGRVEQIYNQVRNLNLDGVTLLSEEKPQSGTSHYALSDSAPQYAFVRGEQTYASTVPFDQVLAEYERRFVGWGWLPRPLNSETGHISAAFKHLSDVYLTVGICTPDKNNVAEYVVFFDFDEITDCFQTSNQLACVSAKHCEH